MEIVVAEFSPFWRVFYGRILLATRALPSCRLTVYHWRLASRALPFNVTFC